MRFWPIDFFAARFRPWRAGRSLPLQGITGFVFLSDQTSADRGEGVMLESGHDDESQVVFGRTGPFISS